MQCTTHATVGGDSGGRIHDDTYERYRIQGGDRIMEREVLSQSDREGKHGSMRRTASSPSPQRSSQSLLGSTVYTCPGQVTKEHPVTYFAPFSRKTITQSFCITSPTFLKEI